MNFKGCDLKYFLKLRERKKERKESLKSRNLKSFLEFSKVKIITLCHFFA